MTHHTNRAPSAHWQPITNEHWPEQDANGPHARNIPTAATEHTPARIRLHFRDDGWHILHGHIRRRANGCAYVQVDDPRVTNGHVWVADRDVRED